MFWYGLLAGVALTFIGGTIMIALIFAYLCRYQSFRSAVKVMFS